MAKKIGEETQVTLDLKTIGMIVGFVITLAGMWFGLQADIATCPAAKKKYRVRMAPTLIIFKDGIKETVFKAGLDLMLPADLNEIQEAVDEVNTASQF